jgi:ribonuclease Z
MFALRVSRTFVGLASLCFAAVALTIWVVPAEAARWLGLEATRTSGTAILRSDLGGLFVALSAICGATAWTRRRPYAVGAATLLTGIVIGRALGWFAASRIGSDIAEMAVELALIAALLTIARGAGTPAAGVRGRKLVRASLALVPVAAAAVLLNPSIQERIYAAGAARVTSTVNTAPLEQDALRVAVCGSSAPLPSPSRAKSCVAVFAGGRFYVVDAGPESVENLVLWGIPMSSVGGVLLTHFHSDHIGDLGELNLQTWAGGRPGPLHVYGGPGVEQVVAGFSQAYALDQGYRTAHHGERVMPSAAWPLVAHTVLMAGGDAPRIGETAIVLEQDGLRITAVVVDHSPIRPAYAYRFDYRGRSAFITGDLKFHPSLASAAKGVDLFLSEAIATSMTRALGEGAKSAGRAGAAAVLHDIEDYHITPEEAAAAANGAGASLLAFYHLLPAPDNALARQVFGHGVDQRRQGDWTIAEDGSLYTMPIGSKDVRIGHVAE